MIFGLSSPFRSLLVAAGCCFFGAAIAAPVAQEVPVISTDSVAGAPPVGADRAPRAGALPGVDSPAASGPSLVRTERRRQAADPAPAPANASDQRVGDHAVIGRRSASSVALEENPEVELADVLRSVALAASRAIPWFHLGSRHRAADTAASLVRPATAADRTRDDSYGSQGRAPGASADAPGELVAYADSLRSSESVNSDRELGNVDLMEEALHLLRNAIAHPLTWLLTVLVVMAGAVVALLHGRAGSQRE